MAAGCQLSGCLPSGCCFCPLESGSYPPRPAPLRLSFAQIGRLTPELCPCAHRYRKPCTVRGGVSVSGGCRVSAFRLPSVRLLLLSFGEWFVPASSRATAPFVCSDRTSNAGAMPVRAQVPKTVHCSRWCSLPPRHLDRFVPSPPRCCGTSAPRQRDSTRPIYSDRAQKQL